MKTIGLIGGMSWESSAEYYRIINQEVNRQLGKNHSARILMYSFDFEEIELLQHNDAWEELTKLMISVASRLESAGSEFLVICTNTMHLMAPQIEAAVSIPLIHIADITGAAIAKQNLKKVGLLGTRFTMKKNFYREWIYEKYGIEVIVPGEEEMDIIHRVIYEELVTGKIWKPSKKAFLEVMDHLQTKGAEGVILGCTEIPLLIKQTDVAYPVFDTTTLHAIAAADLACK